MPGIVTGLNHYTIRCAPGELPALDDFYMRVIGLEKGRRPDIPAPGTWLYAGGVPIVHLYAILDRVVEAGEPVTGPLDHISFKGRDLEATKAHLRAQGVAFTQAPVPGWNIEQLFLRDPKGLKIELTFFLDEEGGRA
ncbi:VOC family protein [Ramlibacter albus]|uniref:Glyoxalase n=1 Tax=Ramlibacter albus TaxID=2079448 RepID=A0A923ME18_9BURK|nr:VOC family protein [Ramlibacter albus]MBC5767724.1 glyoxalase [Ramlibacter albus]